jgi:hypothetical protein
LAWLRANLELTSKLLNERKSVEWSLAAANNLPDGLRNENSLIERKHSTARETE